MNFNVQRNETCENVARESHVAITTGTKSPAETAVIMVEAKCQQVAALLHTVLPIR